jgi:DNA (cytosine-5)-methyltransferase 1
MKQAADLFCGAGGITEGLKSAAESLGLTGDLVAGNHWHIAIATHQENHPEATQ